MNPAEYNMLWMGQFPSERMVLDENSMLSVGMSVLDDMPHQHHSMDMNTMMMPLSEYTAATGQIAITPEIFPTIGAHHQLDPQQQTMLDQYNSMMQDHHASDDIIIQEDDDDDVQLQVQQHHQQQQMHQQQQDQQQQQQHQLQQLQFQQLQQHQQHHQQQQHHQNQQLLLGQDDEDDGSMHYEHHQLIDEDEDDGSAVIIEHHHDEMQQDDVLITDDGMVTIGDGGDVRLIQVEDYHDNSQQFDSDNSAHSLMAVTGSGGLMRTTTTTTTMAATTVISSPAMQATTAATVTAHAVSHSKANASSAAAPTQTNKKIKPVKRPGLVLKTPIAYQPCLDPSVIPIQRDGMAVCERCGAIGVKHSFYTKERRFCSMACARNELERLSYAHTNANAQSANTHTNSATNGGGTTAASPASEQPPHQRSNYRFKMTPHPNNDETIGAGIMYKDILPQDELPQIMRLPSPCLQDEKILTVRRKPSEFYNSYDWHQQLNASGGFYAADVTSFAHAPGCDMWRNIGVGMKVEVENTDCDTAHAPSAGTVGTAPTPHSFWVATVLRICGYKALIRYEGFGDDAGRDFWVNLCSSEVHPVGWCATRGKPLIPPRSIENRYADWKEFLVRHLSGARTLPSTFYNKIRDSFRSRFRTGLQLEVVDKNHISQVKLATVQKIVGKRLFVKYFDAPPDDNGFWCHEDSSLIHPVGWASTVGHNLAAPMEYLERMAGGPDQMIEACEDDSIIDLFRMNFTFEEYYMEDRPPGFEEGMKLEAVDPLNLSSICVATVMAVLKFGYMMIRIDSYEPDATGADWFCYHERSPCIFPPSFCHEHGIVLTPPRGYEAATFRWNQYLQHTGTRPADRSLFRRDMPATASGFQVGMKLECADLMDPRLVCVATVAKVVGRLLKVHFDGWEEEYDQWLDCESPDMYPVGWCVLVGHKLEGPRVPQKQTVAAATAVQKLGGSGAKTTTAAAAAGSTGGSAKQRKRKKKAKPQDNNDKSTNPIIQTRNLTVKKDREAFDQQRHTHELKQMIGSARSGVTTTSAQQQHSPHRNPAAVKKEMKHEMLDDSAAVDMATGAGDYDDDGYSYSTTSGHSTPLPISPEPSLTANSIKNPSVLLDQPLLSSGGRHASSATQQQQQKHLDSEQQSSAAIPRLSDATDAAMAALQPIAWTVGEVTQFLRVNDCAVHGEAFARNQIDGNRLLQLTKDEIITMLDMKVGPSLKIFDLIQQLKGKLNPQQARMQKAAAAVAAVSKKGASTAYLA